MNQIHQHYYNITNPNPSHIITNSDSPQTTTLPAISTKTVANRTHEHINRKRIETDPSQE